MSKFRHTTPAALLVALGAALVLGSGCGGGRRGSEPAGFSVGLATMLGEDPTPAAVEPGASPVEGASAGAGEGADPAPQGDLQSLIDAQAADLAQALGTDPVPEAPTTEPGDAGPDSSLTQILAEGEGAADPAPAGDGAVSGAPELSLEELYARMKEALGRELDTTSEPFRMAVAMVALAAAQGNDPATAIAPGTPAGDRLSPTERDSALAIAGLLGSLLSPESSDAQSRADVLRRFSEQLSSTVGLQIPRAKLCTRVRGFGKYEEFSSTSFLAGRPIRALVYVEVDQFEHGRVDASRLEGLSVEEQWSIELSESLELYHDGEKGMLAWRRPEEVVVETSRNKQRDFYLLTDITLPQTLTVGSYQLKVTVKDRVGDQQASALIPIKIVADPALAWSPE